MDTPPYTLRFTKDTVGTDEYIILCNAKTTSWEQLAVFTA